MAVNETKERLNQYWNAVAGPKWAAMQVVMDARLEALGNRLLDVAGIRRGQKVLDIGCGCGATTMEIAQRVGGSGRAVGLDISRPMLARARERSEDKGVTNIAFIEADAADYDFPVNEFDVVTSRFGTMFFVDPGPAFKNLRTALKPGGCLAFICWRALAENPWAAVPVAAAAPFLELPPPPAPGEPGPFSMADAGHVRQTLESAGYTRIELTPHQHKMNLALDAGLESAVESCFQIGPLSRLLAEASDEQRENVRRALRTALAPFESNGGVWLDSASWLVTAENPAT